MLMIRLSRTGKPKQPYFRLIVSEKSKDPWGSYVEVVGNFNPRSKKLEAKKDRILHWISKGAQITQTLHNILIKEGILSGKAKRAYSLTKKRLGKIETKKADVAAKAAAAAKKEEPKEEPVETTPEVAEEKAGE